MTTYQYFLSKNINNLRKIAIRILLDIGGERAYTYEQLFIQTDVFAAKLENIDITSGDRVAIIAENCPEWCVAYLAIARLNATAVLIDASLESDEIQKLINKSKVRCIFGTPKTIVKLGLIQDIPVLDILNNARPFEGYKCVSSETKTTGGSQNISTILYSSGTTKTASGIMHSHDALLGTTKMIVECLKVNSRDSSLAVVPNSHIYGLICQIIVPLYIGASVCFLESLNADMINRAFREFKPTFLPAVPKMYELFQSQIIRKINGNSKTEKLFNTLSPKCLALRKKTGINMGKVFFKDIHKGFGSKIKYLCSAGAPLNAETADFFYGTGFDILIKYGSTETNIPVAGNYSENITTDSCGNAYPDISVKLDDNGELLVKSPYMMLGYFDDEAATRDAFDEDGWFKTGDLGFIDEKGNVKISGRCKDNIVLATGKKVAPDDIENAYLGIDNIKELVVCGIPCVSNGSYDEIHAFVVTEPYMVESALNNLKQRSAALPINMKLADIHFVDEIPKTSLLKPKRYLLKQMIEQSKPEAVWQMIHSNTPDVGEVVKEMIAKMAGVNISNILPDTKPFSEFAIDSLSYIELICELEERCGINRDLTCLVNKETTVAELTELINTIDFEINKNIKRSSEYPLEKNKHDYNVFKFALRIINMLYNITVKNDEILPKDGGYLICSNHVSNFDYLYLTLNFTRERFNKFCCMAKKELFNKMPHSKTVVKLGGMIPVDRDGFINDSFGIVCEKLKEGWGALVHPEGTRSVDGELAVFKKGAALLSIEAGVPIIPAYIAGGYEVYPRYKKLPNVFNRKEMKKYKIEVRYGEPIFPDEQNADELIKKVKTAVLELKNDIKKEEKVEACVAYNHAK